MVYLSIEDRTAYNVYSIKTEFASHHDVWRISIDLILTELIDKFCVYCIVLRNILSM